MPTAKSPSRTPRPAPVVRRKRTDLIVDAIKQMIAEDGLGPGDRLPQEKDLMTQFSAGKSTVREALKALEVQGLISVRTGPGGGPFIERMSEGRAMSLLSNYLFSKDLTTAHVNALRTALEPLAAASAAPHIDADGYRQLAEIAEHFEDDPRRAELGFCGVVASYSDNPVLAFTCRFLQRLLEDLAPDGGTGEPADKQRILGLVDALRRRDAAAAQTLSVQCMATIQAQGEARPARLKDRFLTEPDASPRMKRKADG